MKKNHHHLVTLVLLLGALLLIAGLQPGWAEAPAASPPLPTGIAPPITAETALFTANNVWMMLATGLVFIMHLGFATVETGFTRSKNTVNILFKNSIIPCIGLLTYAFVGFNLMYPGKEYAGAWFGFSGLGIAPPADGMTAAYASAGYTYWTDFLFQAMFAATAATIVSGAVAERVKLGSFLAFAALFVAFCYPITGMWKWGGGALDAAGFHDFAGSTLVHSVGGWAALVGAIMVGPRSGKYVNGGIRPIPGHSMPLAVIGVFLLWLGWFGFNGGSVLSADPATTSLVLVTTSLSAAAGAIGALLASALYLRTPDLSMVLNGILAGLVGITAGADVMTPNQAMLIGLVSGAVVVFAVVGFDRLRIDDPVGATSVHLVCGVLGTLAVGLLGEKAGWSQLLAQLKGIAAVAGFTLLSSWIIFAAVRKTMGLRVSAEEEVRGLDIGEHEMEAYPDFESFLTK
jgi:Amt family ammonium transporter